MLSIPLILILVDDVFESRNNYSYNKNNIFYFKLNVIIIIYI